jgi:penicillin-binding protein 1A
MSRLLKKILTGAWILFGLGILTMSIIFVLIAKGKIGYMPAIEDLENPISKYATQILTADGKPMGTYSMDKENRVYTNFKDLSPNIVHALIATEDSRFYQHSGIDFYAVFRSLIKRGIFSQESAGGASTISQQLAKILYSEHAENFRERLMQKPVEWVIAVELEKHFSKDEIINLYLNKFDFLYNAVGIKSACWVYFSKQPDEVTLDEAATLIGMCKNPSYYNPIRRPEITKGRRNVVLSLMADQGFITKDDCLKLQQKPLVTRFNRVDHKDGIAPYFREFLRMFMNAHKPERKNYATWQRYSEDSILWAKNPLFGWCNKNKKSDGSNYDLRVDGLKIYTTIDSRMQEYADESLQTRMVSLQDEFNREKANSKTAPFSSRLSKAEVDKIMDRAIKVSDRYREMKKAGISESQIRASFNKPVEMSVFSWRGVKDTILTPLDSIKYMKSFMRAGFMAMDIETGAVRAYTGGINYHYFQFDMVNTGRRQIGSTVKPFLYSLAMESGFTPCDETLHIQQTYYDENGVPWSPDTGNHKADGQSVSIRWGLQNSDNWVTAWLMSQLNPYTFARLLRSYGLKGQIDPVISLCLGPCDATISEMVSAYTTFSKGGFRVDPLYVTRIEDSFGRVIDVFSPQTSEIISEDASYKMLSMLRSVIDGGTGSRMRRIHGLTVPMGGKTGTSQNHSDGWFMCFSPTLVGGAWVGGEDRDIHFERMSEGQGAAMALPIVGEFFKKVYGDPKTGYRSDEHFIVPARYSDPCSNSSFFPDELEQSQQDSAPDAIDDIFR